LYYLWQDLKVFVVEIRYNAIIVNLRYTLIPNLPLFILFACEILANLLLHHWRPMVPRKGLWFRGKAISDPRTNFFVFWIPEHLSSLKHIYPFWINSKSKFFFTQKNHPQQDFLYVHYYYYSLTTKYTSSYPQKSLISLWKLITFYHNKQIWPNKLIKLWLSNHNNTQLFWLKLGI